MIIVEHLVNVVRKREASEVIDLTLVIGQGRQSSNFGQVFCIRKAKAAGEGVTVSDLGVKRATGGSHNPIFLSRSRYWKYVRVLLIATEK
ncbi:hypothetical protein D9M68_938300 [compost metagenome]